MPEPVVVESRVEQVTVFARGARIRRVATLRATTGGPSVVRFGGLPVAVIDDTVRAEVDGSGSAVVTMVRTGFDTPVGEARAEETAEVREARRRFTHAEAEFERLRVSIDRLAGAPIVEDDPTDEPPAPWQAVVAARRALVALRAERELSLRQQFVVARQELDDARRAYNVAVERDHRAGTARAARLHELRKYVELDLAPGASGEVTLRIEYQVAAARWAPSYVARLGEGGETKFELRAVVAQQSGEDWTGVALQLSTAEPEQFAELPELQPQKIGRRQTEPAKRGFKPPPAGAELLYADYDHRFPRGGQPMTTPATTTVFGADADEKMLAEEVWDEGSSRSKEQYQSAERAKKSDSRRREAVPERPAPPPAPMPAMMPMSAPVTRSSGGKAGAIAGAVLGGVAAPFALAAQALSKNAAPGGGGAAYGRQDAARGPTALTPRLDYANLRMAAPASAERGKLVPAPIAYDERVTRELAAAIEKVDGLALPRGHVADWIHTYDYAFASDGKVDIASDGAWHSIALTSRTGSARIRHVAVPREQADVFRVAAIANPFDGPLLPGPIDIYDRGQFLLTSEVDYTPPGGTVDVGLGVDASVKIARNAEFHEEAAGMLRGKLKLIHAITIDVENLSARPIAVEVRERIPVTREGEDDIDVTLGKVDPAWERWTPDTDAPADERLRGGYRWKVELAPRAKKLLRAGYEVAIATKHELVGGNRREP